MTTAEYQSYLVAITTATQRAYDHIPLAIRARASRAHLKGHYEDAWPQGVPEVERFARWDTVRAEIERAMAAQRPLNLHLAKRNRVELPK